MKTYLVYFDETGDDGLIKTSSDDFILTSVYMPTEKWRINYELIRQMRKNLKEKYGLHITEEFHTKQFLCDKDPYRRYYWTKEQKINILVEYTQMISKLDLKSINVIIDKQKIIHQDYEVLEHALKYNIQRIENDSKGAWNYIIITDKGRIAPMRKTARKIQAYNPIQSKFSKDIKNQPITGLIEDILEKDSNESYFIQICDFISYFVHLYYKCCLNQKEMPGRIEKLIDKSFIRRVLVTLKEGGILNLNANSKSQYGLVIYPKKA